MSAPGRALPDSTEAIECFESLAPKVWPPAGTRELEGWLLGFSDGWTKRANSVHCRGGDDGSSVEGDDGSPIARVERCEALYRELGQKVVFKLTAASRPAGLDAFLEARGYELVEPTSVQLMSEAPARWPEPPLLDRVAICAEASAEWIRDCVRINRVAPQFQSALTALFERIACDNPGSAFASIEVEGEAVAQGVAVLRDGYACLCEVATDAAQRRRGHGLAVVAALCRWAEGQGARPWLQVVAANERAIPLYHSLGFREMYRHWYRVSV